MSRAARVAAWLLAGATGAGAATVRADAPAPAPARVEARSADYVLIGVVRGDALDIHLSRALDNSPVRDATVSATFRGAPHPATALVDGGYEIRAPELALPGTTAMEFDVSAGGSAQKLSGALQVTAPAGRTDEAASGSIRQIAWWILNFAVCGAFLVIWSRRGKKADAAAED